MARRVAGRSVPLGVGQRIDVVADLELVAVDAEPRVGPLRCPELKPNYRVGAEQVLAEKVGAGGLAVETDRPIDDAPTLVAAGGLAGFFFFFSSYSCNSNTYKVYLCNSYRKFFFIGKC